MKTQLINARDAARTIAHLLSDNEQSFTPRPLNRFSPEESLWWVIPSSKWPAYQYGKYTFWAENNTLCCGLGIEKGLEPKVALLYSKGKPSPLALDKEWAWYGFLDSLKSGELAEVFSLIEDHIERPVQLEISIHPLRDRGDFNRYETRFDQNETPFDQIRFSSTSNQLSITTDEITNPDFNALKKISSLADLYKILTSDLLAWFWVDFNIWVPFKLPEEGDNPQGLWSAWDITERILLPLGRWVHK